MLELLRQQLRLRFVAAIIPVLLILGLLLLWVFKQITTDIVDNLGERFAGQQVVYDRLRTLDPLFQEITLARKLASSPVITNWAENETNHEYARLGIAKLEDFRALFRDGSYFFAIVRSGHYYSNDAHNTYAGNQLRYTLSPSKKDDAWYYATLKNPRACQINVNNDRHLKVTKVWINCLVRKDDRVLGVIGTGIDLSSFINTVLNSESAGIVNMFVDDSGAIQAHPDLSQIDFHSLTKTVTDRKTVYSLLDDEKSRDRLKAMLLVAKADPKNVKTTSLNMGGENKLFGVAYLPEINWFDITMITPRAWALDRGFTPLASLMMVAIALTLVVFAFALHRFVLVRVEKLNKAVNQLREDNSTIDLQDPSRDEIGRLTSSFVEMSHALRKNKKELESQVSERTNELATAYYRLMRELDVVDKHVITSSTDLRGIIISASEAFCKISGYSNAELVGRSHNIVRHPDMPKEVFKDLWETIQSGKVWRGEIKNRAKDGTAYWVEAIIEPEYSLDGEMKGYKSIRHDITDKKRIEELSVTDRLTGLFNRHKLDVSFVDELRRADRYKRPLSIILFDIDHFKSVNDTFGHQVGDDILVTMADIIRRNIRDTDIAGRWGGEEFLLLCPETNKSGVVRLAEKLRTILEAHAFPVVGQKTASFGVVTVEAGGDAHQLLARADQALYKAKESGRNRIEVG